MTRFPASPFALGALAGLFAACGGAEAPATEGDAPDAPAPATAAAAQVRQGLPLGEGRPDVSGITRTTLRDDDVAAVTRVHFQPGAAEPLHTHDFDLLVVPLTSGRVEWLVGEERTEFLEVGEVQFVPRGTVHQLVNAGDGPLEVIAVALR